MRAFVRSAILAAACALGTQAASAQSARVQIGVLECRGGASMGFIVGSVTHLGCLFRSDGLRPDGFRRDGLRRDGFRREEPYVATIRKLGVDLGITQETALAWAVFAPVEEMGVGALSGNYAGVQGSASVGVGLGANVLVGGSANSIALQPLSVQGSTGLNVAAGLADLELRPGR